MAVDLLQAACGLVLLIAAMAVLQASRAGELSMRTLAALLIGAAGGALVVRLLVDQPEPSHWTDLMLPLGVALWIIRAAWLRRGQPMRRATDWAELDDRGSSRI